MTDAKIGDKVLCGRPDEGYEISHLEAGKIYTVTGYNGTTDYLLEGVRFSWIKDRFKLYEEKTVANGVEGNGKVLNFGNDDLKMFMRVVDRAGRTWIVGPEFRGKMTLQSGSSYMFFCNTDYEASDRPEYIAEYVFAAPINHLALDFTHKGELIWKRSQPKTAQQIAVEELEDSIKASQEKLEQLKRSM